MKISEPKRLLERLHFDEIRGEYSIFIWPSPGGQPLYRVIKPGPVKYRVEIRPEGYIVLIPR
ncbi:hypothetical protein [Burkholderia seminalis]|uniref:hypothetical protein n=1 Tax=Burkholderia seminalis TaxID=488731 RepID=UPI001454583B|nr:hypothetical protein [Burkholderia seminalis]MCA8431891.1 hypothetical protein [Burkholderia seminalis]VWC26068.1 hypothetical protein BSE24067_06124 [Burkholderia seminalis]